MKNFINMERGIKQYLNACEINSVTDIYRNQDKNKRDKHRLIMNNEIVIEFDLLKKNTAKLITKMVSKKLSSMRVNYFIYDHKGRSPHIHIYDIKGLMNLSPDLITEYKKEFIRFVTYGIGEPDYSLCGRSHLIAMEFTKHYKHNNKKELVYYRLNKNRHNKIIPFILNRAKKNLKERIVFENEYDNTWFIHWVMNEQLPRGGRDLHIYKNIAILVANYYKDDYQKIFNKIDKMQYNDSMVYSQLYHWYQWAYKKTFGFGEICNYCVSHNIEIKEKIKKYREYNEFGTNIKERGK